MKFFIFHRDLRIQDNIGFLEMLKDDSSKDWLAAFIFDPKQIEPSKNAYFSTKSASFMLTCISALQHDALPSLRMFYGEGVDVLSALHKIRPLSAIYFNVDYTPYARKRDERILAWCREANVKCVPVELDYSLVHVQGMAKPYQVFTPFYRHYVKETIPKPRTCTPVMLKSAAHIKGKLPFEVTLASSQLKNIAKDIEPSRNVRSEALEIIKRIEKKEFKEYDKTREIPHMDRGTTHLSPYLKYGVVSVREVYHAVKNAHSVSHGIIRELYWRAFYEQVTWWFPKVLDGMTGKNNENKAMREAYDGIVWEKDATGLKAWKEGRTGFPIVDAGMRELNETGWMHNRIRMIVASFLTKDLLIDWREGERYFSTKLVDIYHPSNNGGWQWSSGSGADAQQYYRIFNPWLQAKRYDPECIYIKKWIPELKDVPVKDILSWDTSHKNWHRKVSYPAPMLDHAHASKRALERYKKHLSH